MVRVRTVKIGAILLTCLLLTLSIEGTQAITHGLRHSFVIAHQQIKMLPRMIQQWVGWISTEMLAVYGKALGAEERDLAEGIW